MPDVRESLSLLGFIANEYQAAAFFSRNWADRHRRTSPRDEWMEARAKLGAGIANAGLPRLDDIPSEHLPYVAALRQVSWLATKLDNAWHGAVFRMVEIEPLLVAQYVLDIDRAATYQASLSRPPGCAELLALALPMEAKTGPIQVVDGHDSLTLRCKFLDFQSEAHGIVRDFAGIQFGFAPPLVHVIRYNGRCYLHNGVHRAYAARLAGATAIPCLFREASSPDALGLARDGSSFDLELLESANPPTMHHFTRDKAHKVRLRPISKVIQVSWAESVVVDD